MELELVEVVKDSVIFSVDRAVLSKPARQAVLGVVCSNNDAFRQIHDALTQEVVTGVETDNQLGHHQLVILRHILILRLLLRLVSCSNTTTTSFIVTLSHLNTGM